MPTVRPAPAAPLKLGSPCVDDPDWTREEDDGYTEPEFEFTEYESLVGRFAVSEKIDHSKSSINMVNFGNIKTERFGDAEMRFNLLDPNGIDDIVLRCSCDDQNKKIYYFVLMAKEKLKESGVTIEDEKRFEEIASTATIYTFQQYSDLDDLDERFIGGFYFYLALGLQYDGYNLDDSSTEEEIEGRIANGRALCVFILQLLNLNSGPSEVSDCINFKERDSIIQCFKIYTDYATEFNPKYAKQNEQLLANLKKMNYDHTTWMKNRFIPHGKPAPFSYMETYSNWLPVMLESQLLAYNIQISLHVRTQFMNRLMMMNAQRAIAVIRNLLSLENDIEVFEEKFGHLKKPELKLAKYRNPMSCNEILMSLFNENLDLKTALKHAETLYNNYVEGVIHAGEDLKKHHPVAEYVTHFKRLVTSSIKTQLALKRKICCKEVASVPLIKLKEISRTKAPELEFVNSVNSTIVFEIATTIEKVTR